MRLLAKGMLTNVQILTDEGNVTAIVDPENKISAAHQNIRKIPNFLSEHYGDWVEVLDLSHNKLRDPSPLRGMSNLNTLILDHNLITSATTFPKLPCLKILWVNFNLISDVSLFVPPLARSCPNLQHLSLMGNMAAPISDREASDRNVEKYRRFLISHFEHLRHLDDKSITAIEKVASIKQEPSLIDNLQSFLHNIHFSFPISIVGKNNSIV